MELKEQVRNEVRKNIKQKIGGRENLEEGAIGSTIRGMGSLGGVLGGAGSLVAGGAVSALTLSAIPAFIGAVGLFTAVLGMKMIHYVADKIDDRELKSQAESLSETVQERDQLLLDMDNASDDLEKQRIESEIEKLTKQMKTLGRRMKSSIRSKPELRENLTRGQLDQMDAAIDAAEQGALTNLEEQ